MGRKLDPKITKYEKSDGAVSYRVRLRVGARQTTETFENEAAAQVFVAQVKDPSIGPERAVALRDRRDEASGAYVPTLREMLARHVEGLTGVEDRTRTDYLDLAGRTWIPMLGGFRVDELDRTDVARWVNAASGTAAPKTVRNAHSVLSATLNTAMLEGHLPANPARGTRLPRVGEEDVEDVHFLTHAEFDILFAEVPEEWQPLVVHMFGMGMRWSETTAQQARDVDLGAGQFVEDVWTSAPVAKVIRSWKKGGKVGPPKSKAARRTVVIPPEVVEVIEPLLNGLRPGDLLFRTRTGSRVSHSNFFNRVWKPATMRASICEAHREKGCRCLGSKPFTCRVHTAKNEQGHQLLPEPCGCPGTLPFRPRIHDARHTHASWLIAQGIRLEVIQERLGHEDYLTTRRVYGHLMPDAQLEASAAASLAFARTSLARPAPAAIEPPPPRLDQLRGDA